MIRIRAIFRKELIDGLRDRRALLSVLIFPFFGPLLIVFMLNSLTSSDTIKERLKLPVIGSDYAPTLMEVLEEGGIDVVDPPTDHRLAIEEGEHSIILEVPPEYPDRFNESRPAPIVLHYDDSRTASKRHIREVQSVLNQYNRQLSAIRLLMRGIDPEVTTPIQVQKHDLATPQTKAANLFETIIMFSVLSAFICGVYLAIDTTAGERERGSLEPLLLTPTPRHELLLGKWLACAAFGSFGVVLSLTCTSVALSFVPFEVLGMRLVLGPKEVITILSSFIPFAFFAAGIQLLVAAFAKSFKEAQTYLNMTMFLPMAPGLIMSFKPVSPSLWMAFVPALSHQLTASSILRGEPVELGFWVVSFGSTLALTTVCLYVGTRLFQSEQFFFKQ